MPTYVGNMCEIRFNEYEPTFGLCHTSVLKASEFFFFALFPLGIIFCQNQWVIYWRFSQNQTYEKRLTQLYRPHRNSNIFHFNVFETFIWKWFQFWGPLLMFEMLKDVFIDTWHCSRNYGLWMLNRKIRITFSIEYCGRILVQN